MIELLFDHRSRSPRKSIGSLLIDAVMAETVQANNTITDHPIEGGSLVTDHAYNLPITITLEGVIGQASLFGGGGVEAARDALMAAYRDREPIEVVAGLDTYDRMIIESLVFPRRGGDALRFSATLKQLTFVESRRADLADDAEAGSKDTAASATNAGRQPLEPADPDIAGAGDETVDVNPGVRQKSALKAIIAGLGF